MDADMLISVSQCLGRGFGAKPAAKPSMKIENLIIKIKDYGKLFSTCS